MAASAIRTLPPQQLADELAQLLAQPDDGSIRAVAVALMIQLYEGESGSRLSPSETHFDEELSLALSRLERNTTAADRLRVRQIGEHLHRVGGVPATMKAAARMVEGFKADRAGLRSYILQKRWAGLLG
jgi:hypothetical protein